MGNHTIEALKIILEERYDKNDPAASLRHLAEPGQLIIVDKGAAIINQKDPAKYFYLLLTGRTVILNHISWSIDNIIDYVEPPHILGLQEYLMDTPTYTAFVVADTKCVLFKIPASEFIRLIRGNSDLCYLTLVIVGKVSDSNMSRAEKHQIFRPRDSLGHYLYLQAMHTVPYVCPLTRQSLSEILGINLRSVYRYIDYMEKNEYLTLKKGKIVIEQTHLDKLAARYSDVIL